MTAPAEVPVIARKAPRDVPLIPGVCWSCGGPANRYTGTEHGWRCQQCIDGYLAAGARGLDAVIEQERRDLLARSKRPDQR